ncbi:MAG: hypothetical protein BWY95_01530 [Bacteroidetes bacterium ADurb.BinA104]|nr:MAG: hypothetical protein BWY95_01530 [Bacteroidetes bacterium ADurb.BinA104]
MVIKYFCKYTKDCSFVFINWSLDIDVKENRFGRDIGATDNCRIHHRVVKLVLEEIHGVPACNLMIGQQIGQHF